MLPTMKTKIYYGTLGFYKKDKWVEGFVDPKETIYEYETICHCCGSDVAPDTWDGTYIKSGIMVMEGVLPEYDDEKQYLKVLETQNGPLSVGIKYVW